MSERDEILPAARRPRWQVVAGVVAVLAILGGATAARLLLVGEDRSATTSVLGPPPDGMRWVGMSGVVVAVPEWWTTGETQCYAPVEDTVYFDSAAVPDCSESPSAATVREVSALALLDGTHGYGELMIRDMEPIAVVDGHEVVEAEECEEWFEGVCRRMFAVPSLGVVFAVTIDEPGDGDYDAVRDSLRILPDGMTTVPIAINDDWTPGWGGEMSEADALLDEIHDAGLAVEVVNPAPPQAGDQALYADLPPGSFLGASPGLGSVIEEGGTVTVTVMGRDRRH